MRAVLGVRTATPGAVTAIASLGDTANLHPHIHGMFSDGAWADPEAEAAFLPWPSSLDAERLTQLFRRLVLRMLLRKRRITQATAARLLGWLHSGFSVFLGDPIAPGNHESRRRLARYLVRSPISLERMRYDPVTCQVLYGSTRQHRERRMSALDFLAELSAVVPDRGQHLVSYSDS